MTSDQSGPAAEFKAIQAVYEALEPLDDDARTRIVKYIVDLLQVGDLAPVVPENSGFAPSGEEQAEVEREQAAAPKYTSLAELADSAQPTTQAEKALVAGYWLQVCQGAEKFDAFSANKELKNLGEGVPNITMAIEALRNQKPALALQLQKSGKTRQARKTYKLTVAGVKTVESMINGSAA